MDNTKQTTFMLKILSSEFLNEGSDEIWNALQTLRKSGMSVEVVRTIHGSFTDNSKKR